MCFRSVWSTFFQFLFFMKNWFRNKFTKEFLNKFWRIWKKKKIPSKFNFHPKFWNVPATPTQEGKNLEFKKSKKNNFSLNFHDDRENIFFGFFSWTFVIVENQSKKIFFCVASSEILFYIKRKILKIVNGNWWSYIK